MLVGTITFRKQEKYTYFIGFMVCNINYLGNDFFFNSVKLTIKYVFRKLNIKKIVAGTDKKNIPSSFFLLKLGFQIKDKQDKVLKFVLEKKYE